jgi:hypothetical protein
MSLCKGIINNQELGISGTYILCLVEEEYQNHKTDATTPCTTSKHATSLASEPGHTILSVLTLSKSHHSVPSVPPVPRPPFVSFLPTSPSFVKFILSGKFLASFCPILGRTRHPMTLDRRDTFLGELRRSSLTVQFELLPLLT